MSVHWELYDRGKYFARGYNFRSLIRAYLVMRKRRIFPSDKPIWKPMSRRKEEKILRSWQNACRESAQDNPVHRFVRNFTVLIFAISRIPELERELEKCKD